MVTTRFLILFRAIAVLSIFIVGSGCSSSNGGNTQPPGSLAVTITSPSFDASISKGQSVDFKASISGGYSPYTILWNFNGGANNSTEQDPGLVGFQSEGSYTVELTVTDSTGAAANATVLVNVSGDAPDTPPGIRYTSPSGQAENVPLEKTVQVVFSNGSGIDSSTINSSTFALYMGSSPVLGSVAYSDSVATFTPSAPLQYSTLYTARLTTGVKDLVGNPLIPSDYVWTFTTIGYTLSAVISSPRNNVTVLESTPVNFQGSATGGASPYSYKWNFSRELPPSTEKDPGPVSFSTRGTYTVILRVTDANGHLSTALRTVSVYSTTAGDWKKVSAGRGHTLALKSDGTLWAWGLNSHGQLGIGSLVNRDAPVQVPGSNWSDMAAGYGHSLAIKQDGSLWAWGLNDNGQLGNGTLTESKSPVQVGSNNTWVNVATGYAHSLAIRADGTLWAWGLNNSGQLGDSTFIDRNQPVQAGTACDWSRIAAGYGHSLAIKKDGTAWSWGLNDHGQLGDGTEVLANVPAPVGSENGWVAVTAGHRHSVVLRKDGTLIAWGENMYGQLGDGSTHDSSTPVMVGFDSNWVAVAAGYGHTVAVKKDGTLWSWGLNNHGQLGDGTMENRSVPAQVGSDNTWSSAAGGHYHSGALKTGGTLWTWGNNAYGQLGDRTLDPRYNPAQVKW